MSDCRAGMPLRGVGMAFALGAALCLPGAARAQSTLPGPYPGVRNDGFLLVVTKQAHALAMIEGTTLQVMARVPIGEDPHEVVVGPDGRTAFVSNFGEGTLHTLARVNLLTRQAMPPVDTRPLVGPHGLWVQGQEVWFTAVSSEALGTIDAASEKVTAVLGTGQQNTHMLWISRDGAKILASNAGSGTMSLFDRVAVGSSVVAGSPASPASYTHDEWRMTLLPVGAKAEGFAVSPDEREAWVGNADGTISVLDLVNEKVVARFDVGATGANRLRWTPDGARVLETTHTGKELLVLDAHTRGVIRRVPIEEHGASAIQLDPTGKRAFVACPRDHFVAVVDLGTLQRVATIDAGREPDGMTWWTPLLQ